MDRLSITPDLLPLELWDQVCSSLDVGDIVNLSEVSSAWRAVATSNAIWERCYYERWPAAKRPKLGYWQADRARATQLQRLCVGNIRLVPTPSWISSAEQPVVVEPVVVEQGVEGQALLGGVTWRAKASARGVQLWRLDTAELVGAIAPGEFGLPTSTIVSVQPFFGSQGIAMTLYINTAWHGNLPGWRGPEVWVWNLASGCVSKLENGPCPYRRNTCLSQWGNEGWLVCCYPKHLIVRGLTTPVSKRIPVPCLDGSHGVSVIDPRSKLLVIVSQTGLICLVDVRNERVLQRWETNAKVVGDSGRVVFQLTEDAAWLFLPDLNPPVCLTTAAEEGEEGCL